VATHQFSVVRAFKATSVISGRERQLKPRDTLLSDTPQIESMVTLELDKSFFLVERAIFQACCKWENVGGPL
jgi:hypothetical protein